MKIDYPPIKSPSNHASKAYADICAHTNEIFRDAFTSDDFYYLYPKVIYSNLYGEHDLCTSAHETTHQINSEIANSKSHRDKSVGLYTLNNIGWVINEPKPLTIQQVAQKVPQEWQGGILGLYDLYLVRQASSWGDRPLYLCDELVSYTNGSIVALEATEAGVYKESRGDSLQGCIYFGIFTAIMFSMAKSYQDEIYELLKFSYARLEDVFQRSQKYPNLVRPENKGLLDKFYASEYFQPFNKPDLLDGYDTSKYL